MKRQRAIIIGAGPAGLTAAYELVTRTGILPVVLEKSEYMGGLSRTVEYKGNRIDIGGHRFFSKSDRVMKWWLNMLPLAKSGNGVPPVITYQNQQTSLPVTAPSTGTGVDGVMLLRPRKSRIYFLRKLFAYPVSPSLDTLRKLGPVRTVRIALSYLRRMLIPLKNETNLQEYLINRFGRELYRTFFQSYTEKVWGVPCDQISAEWGAQRIKGLSVRSALQHAFKKSRKASNSDGSDSQTHTSLIEQFLYPEFGPGQLWDAVARRIREAGGEIHTGIRVDRIQTDGDRITGLSAICEHDNSRQIYEGDYFFSTAPVQELIRSLDVSPPANVQAVSDGLVYRDFITVGILVRTLRIRDDHPGSAGLIRDNWIYIQEPGVLVGRMQIFNNWSPGMVADPGTVWIGLEYFCNQSDDIWKLPDDRMIALAIEELARIQIADASDVLDATVIRMEKAYPAYFGSYDRFPEIREYLDRFDNLFLIGRNGMHRYNNQDHSMLTAMKVVDGILAGKVDREELWSVNTETDHHEEKTAGADEEDYFKR